MCESCPAHLLGPGEVAGKVARSKVGRKVLVGFCYVMFAGIVVTTLGWWLVPIMLGLAALAEGVRRVLRLATRGTVSASPAIRQSLAARGVPALAPGQPARPALPRAVVRSLTGRRQALPAPARALPGVVTGKVVPAPVRKVGR